MEKPTPFDLNEAIRQWQRNLSASPAFSADNLEEIASHLRASVQKLKATGHSEKDAFDIAVQRIGERGSLEREFAKVNAPGAWSLSVVSIWIVAGLYLLQVGQSLVLGMLAWRELLNGRAFQRFLAGGPSAPQIYNYFQLHSLHYQRSFVPIMSIVVVLVFGLGVRLATGSWRSIGTFLTCFERPISTSLRLAVLGLVITVWPAFLPGLLSAIPSVHMKIWVPPDGLTGRAVVNVTIVFMMVLLSRPALRNTSPTNPAARRIQFRRR
jgi:hypothetical protein